MFPRSLPRSLPTWRSAALAAMALLALAAAVLTTDARAVATPAKPSTSTVAVLLTPEQADYFVKAGPSKTLRYAIDARRAPPKPRIFLLSPLRSGHQRIEIAVSHATASATFVIATPIHPGRAVIDLRIESPGRYDLGFWTHGGEGHPPKEYRYTFQGPSTTLLTLDLD